jgi:hypothetical protein
MKCSAPKNKKQPINYFTWRLTNHSVITNSIKFVLEEYYEIVDQEGLVIDENDEIDREL